MVENVIDVLPGANHNSLLVTVPNWIVHFDSVPASNYDVYCSNEEIKDKNCLGLSALQTKPLGKINIKISSNHDSNSDEIIPVLPSVDSLEPHDLHHAQLQM